MNSPTDLVRHAARLGPGYRGRRQVADPGELQELVIAFRKAGLEPPPYLDQPVEWIERRAKLFETGVFPDKGVTITPAVLRDLQRTFDLPVPVLIEHAASPLELGYLIDVEVDGSELFGTLALSPEANALVEKSGATSLSLGLNAELTEIREVSLVRNPRIADARLFFTTLEKPENDWQTRYETLQSRVRSEKAERQAETLVRQSKLTPAQVPFATALFQLDDAVVFDGQSTPVARLVLGLIESRPACPLFAELAAAAPGADHSASLMLPEEAEFYRRYFPDVSLDQIAAKR